MRNLLCADQRYVNRQQNFCSNYQFCYATASLATLRVLPVGPSVCLSLPYGFLTREVHGVEESKLVQKSRRRGITGVPIFASKSEESSPLDNKKNYKKITHNSRRLIVARAITQFTINA